mmetsp:Transcript_16696/g.14610  ORF Transcript_16696/g.14610 Transcript_16696/m.14610 type:complete len:189 (+) Transcript_16696:999-1565(+)
MKSETEGKGIETIVSIATSVKVNDSVQYSNVKLHSIICNTKSLRTLQEIPDQYLAEGNNLKIDIYFKLKYLYSGILTYINSNFEKICTSKNIQFLQKDDMKLIIKYQSMKSLNKDPILLSIAQWTYYNGNDDSYDLLNGFELTDLNVKTLVTVIRDYPNMREDISFKEKLFEIGQQSEEEISKFIKKF